MHGVKGFDSAYKRCAQESTSPRFFTIDGDNELSHPLPLDLDFSAFPPDAVLSWAAKNSVNGLQYGNGGIKNWPKALVLQMKTHERTESETAAVDFCFDLRYFQMPETLSVARIDHTPFQAFRAGFREGVKMCLDRGKRPDMQAARLRDQVWHENLARLRIWCSVGADTRHGLWAMYGASLGCRKLCLTAWDPSPIRDYDWFQAFWSEEIWPRFSGGTEAGLLPVLALVHSELNEALDLRVAILDESASRFFKSVYTSPPRKGLMFP